jgi:hypothetical protein
VAKLLVDDDVTVSLSAVEKAEALHGDVSVPRAAVVSVQVVPDGLDEVHGLRMPGTALPGVIMVGTWRDKQGVTFAVCHGRQPAVVVELTGQRYDRLVVTVENPGEVAVALA